jgi:hypothetical protein
VFYYYCVYNNVIALYYVSFYLLIPFITLPKRSKLLSPFPKGNSKNSLIMGVGLGKRQQQGQLTQRMGKGYLDILPTPCLHN